MVLVWLFWGHFDVCCLKQWSQLMAYQAAKLNWKIYIILYLMSTRKLLFINSNCNVCSVFHTLCSVKSTRQHCYFFLLFWLFAHKDTRFSGLHLCLHALVFHALRFWLSCSSMCNIRYIRLYGRKFSKEDHVLFIKLLYELVTIPRLEISMMQGLARLLINLLK